MLLVAALVVAGPQALPVHASTPGEPGAVTVSNLTSTSATLKWGVSPGGGIEGYRVLRGAAGASLDVRNLIVTTDGSVTSYKVTNLYSGTTYQFGVIALDINDAQSPMRSVTLTTATSSDNAAPAAPSSSNVTATAFSSSRIDVLWAASSSSNVASYQVFRNGTQVGNVDLPGTPRYSDNGLAASSTYVYTIRAVSSNHVVSAATSGRSATTLASGVARIARGPLLEQVTSTSAEVTWWTNIPTQSVVSYGIGGYTQTLSDTTSVLQHVVGVSSLSPGTTYQYKVGDGSTVSSAASFSTAALPGTSFTFGAIGDFGAGGGGETQNATALATDSSQFIQTLGDNIYPSAGLPDPDFATTYSDFDARLYKPFAKAVSHKSFNPADGNKEYYGDGEFWQNFDLPNNHRWYSYDWGDAHFVVLDSELPVDPASSQYSFLQSDLNAHQDSRWRIVAMQKPPYSSTSSGASFKNAQTYLVPLFQTENVNLVLSGNSHNYERTFPLLNGAPAGGGITYVVSGGGGNAFNPFTLAQPAYTAFREASYYEHLDVTVSPTALTVNGVKATDGSVFDSVTIPFTGTSSGPSQPANLQARVTGQTSVSLSWSASSDSTSTITGYNIYRNSAFLTAVGPSTLTFDDTGLTPATTYGYGVSAVDAASKESTQATTTVTTQGSTSSLMFTPTDDATIDAGSPSANLGTNAALTVDHSPVNDFLMRFSVIGTAGCTVTKATLSLTVRTNSTANSSQGGQFYAAVNSNWSESSVTWASAPAAGPAQLAALGSVALGTTYQVDVTPLVIGDGAYTIRVSSTSSDAAQYNSKEGSATLGPQLQVTCNSTAAATHFLLSSPVDSKVGTPFQEAVTALDANNRTVTTYTGNKSLSWSGLANSPGGDAPAFPTNPVSFSNGAATVTITPYDAQSTTLSVTDGDINGTSGTFTIRGLGAGKFSLSDPGQPTAGGAFPETVSAVDTYGNVDAGYTGPSSGGSTAISFIQEAGATESASAATLQASIGSTGGNVLVACIGMYSGATLSTKSITDSGGNTWQPMPAGNPMFVSGHNSRGELWYSVTSSADTWVQANFSAATSAAMSVLEFSGVAAIDVSAGAANTGASASSGATGALSTTGELAVGFATIHASNAAITSTATGYTAASQRNTTTASNLVGVRAGYNLNAGTAPAAFTATTPSVYWASGVATFKPKSSPPSGVLLSWSGLGNAPNGAASPTYSPNPVIFSSGVATVSITPYRAEPFATVSVSDGSLSGSAGPFTVAPGAASLFSVQAPATATAGTAVDTALAALDQYGNTATGYAGSHALNWSGPNTVNGNAPSFPASVSFTDGIGSASVILYAAETTGLTAAEGSITGTSAPVTVSPGPTFSLALSLPASAAVGQPVQASASAYDRWGNVATGDASDLSVTSSDPLCGCPSPQTLSGGQVSFDVVFNSPDGPGEQTTLTVTLDSSGLSATASTTVGTTGPSGPRSVASY